MEVSDTLVLQGHAMTVNDFISQYLLLKEASDFVKSVSVDGYQKRAEVDMTEDVMFNEDEELQVKVDKREYVDFTLHIVLQDDLFIEY